MNKSIIETFNLTKIYYQGKTQVFANNDINLRVREGEFVAIVGSSGSGKTTLLNMLGGIESPTSGKIIVDGVDLSKIGESKYTKVRAKKIGYVFQKYNLIYELNVRDNLRIVQNMNGWDINEQYEDDIVHLLGIENLMDIKPSQLSGGQQQRVAIGRALIGKPSIILADEPTGNLDRKNTNDIINYLIMANKELNQTYIIVTHDLEVANRCSRIISIEDGKVRGDIVK